MTSPYNANPNYKMNMLLLTDINQHMESMFKRYSKLLPFRIDLGYRKGSASFNKATVQSIIEDVQHFVFECIPKLPTVGHYWVVEYAKSKGLHIHFVFYLNGQFHQKYYPIARELGTYWDQRTTGREGYHHICIPKDIYEVRIGKVISYNNEARINDLRYVLSYLAKRDQKRIGIIGGKSNVPVKSPRGRPRTK
ncbi:TPA: hypothetical protein ACQJNN_001845 [Citrobacter freundii]